MRSSLRTRLFVELRSHGPVPAVTSEASVFSAPSTSKQLLAVEDVGYRKLPSEGAFGLIHRRA